MFNQKKTSLYNFIEVLQNKSRKNYVRNKGEREILTDQSEVDSNNGELRVF